jgi:hypothetical protein
MNETGSLDAQQRTGDVRAGAGGPAEVADGVTVATVETCTYGRSKSSIIALR